MSFTAPSDGEERERRTGRKGERRKAEGDCVSPDCHNPPTSPVFAFEMENGLVTEKEPAQEFEAVRSRLFGLSYRMLGSRADAEDIVQETYVRWHQMNRDVVENPEAWLVTAATRLAIDRLRRLKIEREAYVGPWLPEPIVSETWMPDKPLELAADLSIAMLTLLETLAPEERAAFLLHDVFDVDYDRIAGILDRTEPACRQMVHRARQRVRGDRKRFESTEAEKSAMLERFKSALEARDEQALFAFFAPDAVWTADGGGKTAASPRPLEGRDTIVKLLLGLRRIWPADRTMEIAFVNGEPGLVFREHGRLVAAAAFDISGGRIDSVYAVVNPDKLSRQ